MLLESVTANTASSAEGRRKFSPESGYNWRVNGKWDFEEEPFWEKAAFVSLLGPVTFWPYRTWGLDGTRLSHLWGHWAWRFCPALGLIRRTEMRTRVAESGVSGGL